MRETKTGFPRKKEIAIKFKTESIHVGWVFYSGVRNRTDQDKA